MDRNQCQIVAEYSEDGVALRKESVDRNGGAARARVAQDGSLSARRAWIEISAVICGRLCRGGRSPQGERG